MEVSPIPTISQINALGMVNAQPYTIQTNVATGDATNTARVNDGTVVGILAAQYTVDQYSEVDLGDFYIISLYRFFGFGNPTGDGVFTLSYKDGADWIVFATVGVRAEGLSWTLPIRCDSVVNTRYIRITCTTVDTTNTGICEFEVMG